jgi:lantibiotic biosynthesis dehydratase-like protein
MATRSVTLSIPAPQHRQDSILIEVIAPLLREIGSSSQLEAAYFERFNKPDWGISFHLLGLPGWIDEEAHPLIKRRIESVVPGSAFVPEEAEDKWVGGLRERENLKRIYHLDTAACLEWLCTEARGTPMGSRAQFSLLLIERLLDLFGLAGEERFEFYRRGFQWEMDHGRWDEGAVAVLEEKYESQKDALRSVLECRPGGVADEAWGGAASAGIALRLLDSLRGTVESLFTAHAPLRLERGRLDLAVFAAHAHSNRLAIHATQEATLRYLAWRAHGGRPGGDQ